MRNGLLQSLNAALQNEEDDINLKAKVVFATLE